MTDLARTLSAVVAMVGAGGCLRATEQACVTDEQCSGGRCESDGRCSFSDPACPSGWRYGDGAGDMSGVCVGGSGGPDAADGPDGDARVDGGGDAPIDGPGDGPTDAAIDGLVGDLIPHVRAQDEAVGLQPITFGNGADYTINTGTLTISPTINLPIGGFTVVPQDGGGPDLALLRVSAFTLPTGSSITVTGSRPLVVLAQTIDVQGPIEAGASHEAPGPGGLAAGMGDGFGRPGGHSGTSDSGGGGGSFGTAGGNGGAVNSLPGGIAGGVHGDPTIPTLIGGSGGGTAYQNATCPQSGLGGGGGGAIQMYASMMLVIGGPGSINTGGGGGAGGNCSAEALAGGGGGSGGAIYLQSPILRNMGLLTAKGGGGGGGASPGTPGLPGADGFAGAGSALGGSGGGLNSGAGGDGSNLLGGSNGENGASNAGGGGGGGGRIVLRYRDNLAVGTTAPMAVLTPY